MRGVNSDVVITDDEIRAKTASGLLGEDKLIVDRRTGETTFGGLRGTCEKAAEGQGRKF